MKPNRTTSRLLAGLALVSLMVGGACGGEDDDDAAGGSSAEIEGVETFDVDSADHVEGEVDYEQIPPVGGDHNKAWITCGYYSQEVPKEMAVHSMEHGAVWVTYRPGLDQAQGDKLKGLAENGSYLLVTPFEGLPAAVVASAWGVQMQLDSADDPRLEAFLDKYRQGEQTPEPGAPCTGGLTPG